MESSPSPPDWLKDLLSSREDIKWEENRQYNSSDRMKGSMLNSCFNALSETDKSSASYHDGITTITVTRIRAGNGYQYYAIEEYINARTAYIPVTDDYPCDCDEKTVFIKGCQCGGR
jgi:hypothetical protein